MSAQRLSEKKVRKIAREVRLDVVVAWGHGGHVFGFATADHLHGDWDMHTGEWLLYRDQDPAVFGEHCYTSCRYRFLGEPEPVEPEPVAAVVPTVQTAPAPPPLFLAPRWSTPSVSS